MLLTCTGCFTVQERDLGRGASPPAPGERVNLVCVVCGPGRDFTLTRVGRLPPP